MQYTRDSSTDNVTEDAARKTEHFDASQHLSQSGCPVEGKCETHT